MEKIRIGIIGLGGIATRSHLPALATFPDVIVQAGAEVDSYQADRTQQRFSIPKIYSDYQELIEHEVLDAVYICLPNSLHYQAASLALSHGLHVYCEKPMGLSAHEAQSLVEQATTSGLVLMPGYHLRYHKHFLRAEELLTKRRLGKILQIQASAVFSGPYRGWDPKSDWHLNPRSGGPLYDWGSHLLDLLLFITKVDIKSVYAFAEKTLPSFPLLDSIVASFQTDKQAVGTINLAWGTRGNLLMLQIHGSAGSLIVSDDYYEHRVPMGGGLNKVRILLDNVNEIITQKTGAIIRGNASNDLYIKSAKHFIDLIRGNIKIDNAMNDAVHVHRVLGAIADSIDQKKCVDCFNPDI